MTRAVMTETTLILKAYYEAVYDLLESAKDSLTARIGDLLTDKVEQRGFGPFIFQF